MGRGEPKSWCRCGQQSAQCRRRRGSAYARVRPIASGWRRVLVAPSLALPARSRLVGAAPVAAARTKCSCVLHVARCALRCMPHACTSLAGAAMAYSLPAVRGRSCAARSDLREDVRLYDVYPVGHAKLRRYVALRATNATPAPGLRATLPHQRQDWACPFHICVRLSQRGDRPPHTTCLCRCNVQHAFVVATYNMRCSGRHLELSKVRVELDADQPARRAATPGYSRATQGVLEKVTKRVTRGVLKGTPTSPRRAAAPRQSATWQAQRNMLHHLVLGLQHNATCCNPPRDVAARCKVLQHGVSTQLHGHGHRGD